jgi:hypothetical protein
MVLTKILGPLLDSSPIPIGLHTPALKLVYLNNSDLYIREVNDSMILPTALSIIIVDFVIEPVDRTKKYVEAYVDTSAYVLDAGYVRDLNLALFSARYINTPSFFPVPYSTVRDHTQRPFLHTTAGMYPWQYSATTDILQKLRQPLTHTWRGSIRSAGPVRFTLSGYVRVANDNDVITPDQQLSFGSTFLQSKTGTGKTRVAIAVAADIVASTSNTEVEATDRLRLSKTVAIVVPPHIVAQWKCAIETQWPACNLRTLVDARSFKQLDSHLRSGTVDILLVSTNVFMSNKTTMNGLFKSSYVPEEEDVDYRALLCVQFALVIIDEVHRYAEKTDRMCRKYKGVLSTDAAVLRMLFCSDKQLLISATPKFEIDCYLDTYLLLSGMARDRPSSIDDFYTMCPWSRRTVISPGPIPYETRWWKTIRIEFLRNRVYHSDAERYGNPQQILTHVKYKESSYIDTFKLRGKYTSVDGKTFTEWCTEDAHARHRKESQRTIRNNMIPRTLDYFMKYVEVDQKHLTGHGVVDIPSQWKRKETPTFPNYAQMSPEQLAAAYILTNIVGNGGRVLIHAQNESTWPPVETALRDGAGISCTRFNGTLTNLNKKRKRFEDGGTILFIPKQYTDGTNLPSTTHILVYGSIIDRSAFQQLIGRALRSGRTSDLHVIKLVPVR